MNLMGPRFKTVFLLQLLLLFYSLTGILSKLASKEPFFSVQFAMLYIGILVILGIYAIGWQQILKRLPLSTAYSNRAINVVWGILWGLLFFSEPVTVGRIIGALFIVAGIILFSHSEFAENRDVTSTKDANKDVCKNG